jgi:hypothetical protein
MYTVASATSVPYFAAALGTEPVNEMLFRRIAAFRWISSETGAVLQYHPFDFDPADLPRIQRIATVPIEQREADIESLNHSNARYQQIVAMGGVPVSAKYRASEWRPRIQDFQAVARCLWSLVFGLFGGMFARRVHLRALRASA